MVFCVTISFAISLNEELYISECGFPKERQELRATVKKENIINSLAILMVEIVAYNGKGLGE
jgi:hypothetical protein